MSAVADDVVFFQCAAGEGAGVWCSPALPSVGDRHDVELDVDEDAGRFTADQGRAVRLEQDHVVLGGVLCTTEAGLVSLEVSGSHVLLNPVGPRRVPSRVPVSLTVPVRSVRVFPTGF